MTIPNTNHKDFLYDPTVIERKAAITQLERELRRMVNWARAAIRAAAPLQPGDIVKETEDRGGGTRTAVVTGLDFFGGETSTSFYYAGRVRGVNGKWNRQTIRLYGEWVKIGHDAAIGREITADLLEQQKRLDKANG